MYLCGWGRHATVIGLPRLSVEIQDSHHVDITKFCVRGSRKATRKNCESGMHATFIFHPFLPKRKERKADEQ